MKALQEKDEVESMVQKTQDTMVEQLLNIGEVNKGFREKILDLKLRITHGTPPKVHEWRVRMETIVVFHNKKIEY